MKNLKKLREARGISQQKLANQFCLSQQSIHKYENGLAEPDFSTLVKFADFFHTSIDYLIGYQNADDQHMSIVTVTPENIQEAHHLALYRKLSPNIKKHLDEMLEDVIESTSSDNHNSE